MQTEQTYHRNFLVPETTAAGLESMPVLPLSEFSQNRFLGYPHTNCFAGDGRTMVVGSSDDNATSLWRIELDSGREQRICEFPLSEKMGYFDVARDASILVAVTERAIWLYDLKDCSLIATHQPAPSGDSHSASSLTLDALPGITADGREVVVGVVRNGRYGAYHLDVPGNKGRILFEFDWHANHFHFCPHDKNWIAFSHEGRCDLIPDRVWAWHAELAPGGKVAFDQQSADEGGFIQVGHERWCFHDTSALVVAYGSNPAVERGVYEAFPDGRPSKFVYQGQAWHVNVSADGRWAAIDTMGAHYTDADADQFASDILVIDLRTGDRRVAARSRIGASHPSHPHPAFSPDGRFIFFNEADHCQKSNRICYSPNPFWTPKPEPANPS